VRLGTPAGTTRGFGVAEFTLVGDLIGDVLDGLEAQPEGNPEVEATVRARVIELCRQFPIYTHQN
jgi:glycine hydroxymethyltransferase